MTDYGKETPSAALARIRVERFIEAELKRQDALARLRARAAAQTATDAELQSPT